MNTKKNLIGGIPGADLPKKQLLFLSKYILFNINKVYDQSFSLEYEFFRLSSVNLG